MGGASSRRQKGRHKKRVPFLEPLRKEARWRESGKALLGGVPRVGTCHGKSRAIKSRESHLEPAASFVARVWCTCAAKFCLAWNYCRAIPGTLFGRAT